nr:ribonuclease H-like domain-containing protein [Tanacetum cinerariifolium]
MLDSQVNDKYKIGVESVSPPYTGNFMPPKPDLIPVDVDEYVVSESVTSLPAVVTNEAKTSESKPKSVSEPLTEDRISDSEDENETETKEFVKKEEHHRQAKTLRKNGQSPRETECVVLSLDFKLLDESQVLLRVPKKNNMYSVDLKNIAPSRGLTCLFAKATLDESNLWLRRLGHINFKTMNKLVKENLVRGLPSKFLKMITFVLLVKKESNIKLLVRPRLTPSLSFMRPLGCPVTILNTLDHLDKFDGKDDKGFFVGYSVNSKAFRAINSGTKIVEDTLHITFLENKPNITGSGPTWLFDIDTLTKSINYKPVVARNQSNGSKGKARMETVPDKDYILLPLWTLDPLFSSSSKDSPGDGFKPSGEVEKKDAEDPRNEDNEVLSTEETRVNQEKEANVNSTNNINVVSSTVNAASNEVNDVGRKSSIKLTNNLNMPDLEDISIFEDSNEDVGEEADVTNMDTNINIYRNKKDERGIVVRNKARLVAQSYTQEEEIDYDEVFALVVMIEEIRTPSLSFMRPFKCPVIILNTLDHLGNEDNEVLSTEEPRVNQEKEANVNNTNNINAVSSTVNAASNEINAVGRKSSIELSDDPNMPDLEEINIFEDSNEDVFDA